MKNHAMVEIRSLNYTIKNGNGTNIPILHEIDLSIHEGEFVGLIGPNGAGKTTLLKCIGGILTSEGTILLRGQSLSKLNMKERARLVALMRQDTVLSFPFPSLEVVLMGRYPHLRWGHGESGNDYRIARHYLAETDALHLEKRSVTELSGGEKQRILLAKTLTQETDLLLLDEPSANLDLHHQEEIFKFARNLARTGKTVITAAHDLRLASRYCSRLVLLQAGRIIADGEPSQVLTPANLQNAYGVRAVVFRNHLTGLWDFYLYERQQSRETSRIHPAESEHIHIIGGGGSAAGVIRSLSEAGYRLSAGVLFHGETDLETATVFGVETVRTLTFGPINDEAFQANMEFIRRANRTILCNMEFGPWNLRNLEAAGAAGNLIIIEDTPPETRDYTGGVALGLYRKLRERAVVTTTEELIKTLYSFQ